MKIPKKDICKNQKIDKLSKNSKEKEVKNTKNVSFDMSENEIQNNNKAKLKGFNKSKGRKLAVLRKKKKKP